MTVTAPAEDEWWIGETWRSLSFDQNEPMPAPPSARS